MELMINSLFTFLKILRLFWLPISSVIFRRKPTNLPPIKNDLLLIPVADLAEKIRKREVSAEEVLRAYIDRAREVNPILNALVDDRFDEALKDAKNADRMVAEKSIEELEENFPLLGIPFSVKASIGVRDLNFSVGSLARKNAIKTDDSECVKILQNAGAIPICVTNVPEYCLAYETYNHVHGRTLNPYDLNRTPGGSSGGEAALISSGGSIFGIGSDVGGSVRIPALFCGLFGHKPTPGVVSLEGLYPDTKDEKLAIFLCVGPITRYARDLVPIMKVMSRNNPKLKLDRPIAIKNIEICYKLEFNGVRMQDVGIDDSMKKSMLKAVEYFETKVGSTCSEANIDLSKIYVVGTAVLMSIKNAPNMLELGKEPTDKKENCHWEMFKTFFGMSQYTFQSLVLTSLQESKSNMADEKISKYCKEFEDMKNEFLELLKGEKVLFFPTFGVPACRHYEAVTLYSVVPYTQLFNVLGFPATHVPMGLNKDGLPVGFQIVAAPYEDRLCFAVATEIERVFGGWTPPY